MSFKRLLPFSLTVVNRHSRRQNVHTNKVLLIYSIKGGGFQHFCANTFSEMSSSCQVLMLSTQKWKAKFSEWSFNCIPTSFFHTQKMRKIKCQSTSLCVALKTEKLLNLRGFKADLNKDDKRVMLIITLSAKSWTFQFVVAWSVARQWSASREGLIQVIF